MNKFWFLGTPLALWCGCAPSLGATQMIIISLETASRYDFHLWVPFGSTKDTVPGIAHVLEHLKFKSGGEHGLRALDKISGSNSNASTNWNYTRYDLSIDANHLAEAVTALSGITQPLNITPDDLTREKEIVKQELFQRYNGNPDTPFFLEFSAKLFEGSEMAVLPGGTQTSVESVQYADVLQFDAAHYQGSDSYLILAGPPLSEDTKIILEKAFPDSNQAKIEVNRKRNVSFFDAEMRSAGPFLMAKKSMSVAASQFTKEASSEHITSTRLVYSKLSNGATSMTNILAAKIVEKAVASRLKEGLRDKIAEDAGLVSDYFFAITAETDNLWKQEFYGELSTGVAPEMVSQLVKSYLHSLAATGLSAESFERLRTRYFLRDEWDDSDNRIEKLGDMAVNYGYSGAADEYQNLKQLTVQDVNGLLKILDADGREGVGILLPKAAQP